ncbi:GntP family permease [Natranaerofaba carboxydovora]|uniref:GntP family permease n=1 Tax=Natranaerofaba carboxydovora TaxID=2742683 RepID=UPI001F12B8D8|nr:SLC13 family permease [Natranaerofaba carboxydovora]UMZ74227.1 GntP family permease [Natranaerofaba carboxydovora]
MLGVLGVIVALALIIFLAYKGVSIIAVSLFGSIVVILSNQVGIWVGLSEYYIDGFSDFAGTYLILFVFGSLFGKVMGDSGCASSISYKLLDKFGEEKSILVLILATVVLTYGGVNLFIVVFAAYPIAVVLFRNANLPKRLLVACIGLGGATITMTAFPGTPAIQNIIPSQVLGTPPTAAPIFGLVTGLVILVLGYMYIMRQARLAKEHGDGFVPGPRDNAQELSEEEKAKLPDWKLALLPMVIVIVLLIVLASVIELPAIFAVNIALLTGTIVTYLLNWIRIERPLETLNVGMQNSIMALINTSCIVGFGSVVQNVDAFQSFVNFAFNLPFPPLISVVFAVNIIAGITGSASGGLTIFMETMGTEYVNMGLDPEILHRVSSLSSGGLDSLPHSGAVITVLTVIGVTHKEAYKDLGMVTAAIPVAVTIIGALIYSLII